MITLQRTSLIWENVAEESINIYSLVHYCTVVLALKHFVLERMLCEMEQDW